MNRRTTILLSSILIAAFMLFNVGVPVVHYLCPLMSSDNPVCPMGPLSTSNSPSLTNPLPSCCAKYIVAERNTNPFVKIQHDLSYEIATISAAAPSLEVPERQPVSQFLVQPSHSPPADLFVLHSTFLI